MARKRYKPEEIVAKLRQTSGSFVRKGKHRSHRGNNAAAPVFRGLSNGEMPTGAEIASH